MRSWRPQKEQLTQLSDVVLAGVARQDDGAGEERRLGSFIIQPVALMLAHLGGGLPPRLYDTAVHHLCVERRRRGHCDTTESTNHSVSVTSGVDVALSSGASLMSTWHGIYSPSP